MTRVIRVSERGTFKRCRQRWDYSSPARQGLAPRGAPTALTFGSLIHAVLEKWLLEPDIDVEITTVQCANEELKQLKARYKEAVGVNPNDDELDAFYQSVELAIQMMVGYKEHWGGPLPEGFELVQPEQTLRVPVYPGPDYEHVVLQGTLDGLLRDTISGQLFILEHKTYGIRPRVDTLENNDQFLAYMWMAQQVFGEPIGGMVYDGMWKREVTKKRTLDDIYFRTVLTRPQHELDMFATRLVGEVQDMLGSLTSQPNIYLNRRWEGCHDCPFDKLCQAESRGEDAEYIRKTYYVQKEGTEDYYSS